MKSDPMKSAVSGQFPLLRVAFIAFAFWVAWTVITGATKKNPIDYVPPVSSDIF